MDHLLFGASFPFLLGVAWYAARRFRATPAMLILIPLLMAVCAGWAVIPDLPRVLGYHDLYMRWHFDPRFCRHMDIFFWHHRMDQVEVDSPWYMIAWVAMAFGLLATVLRELRKAEES